MILATVIVVIVVGFILLFSFVMSKAISHVERTRPIPPKPKMNRVQAIVYLKGKSKP